MERPPKRPRLALLNEPTPNTELEHARYLNDLSLKSRFESIFEKYSRDFVGIGDEIDLLTGDVLIDNGHLASMVNETDADGNMVLLEEQQNGKSLLRAMTALPEEQDAYFNNPISNEIVMSIEQIAENASSLPRSQEDTDESSESEDDLFDRGGCTRNSPLERSSGSATLENEHQEAPSWLSESDHDSLFAEDVTEASPSRASSPDSLFRDREYDAADSTAIINHGLKPDSVDSGIDLEISDEAILDKFGPGIGPQVLEIIEKTRQPFDKHIEPAWRIPVDIGPSPSLEKPSPPFLIPVKQREASPNAAISIWGTMQPKPPLRKLKKEPDNPKSRVESLLRDESLDPLQDADDSEHVEVPSPMRKPSAEADAAKKPIINETSAKSNRTSTHSVKTTFGFASDNSDDSDDPTYRENKRRSRRPKRKVPVKQRASAQRIEKSNADQDSSVVVQTLRASGGVIARESESVHQVDEVGDDTPVPEDSGFCVYCQRQLSCKSSVMAHWDRLIKRFRSHQLPKDDPHDLEAIRIARGPKITTSRRSRLTLIDFRTMVELHEGAGISFDEIAESKALRTHKQAGRLRDVYDQHRTMPLGDDPVVADDDWSAEEVQTLEDMCKNNLVTLTSLARTLKRRDELEIGNRLAAGWLKELADRIDFVAQQTHLDDSMDNAATDTVLGRRLLAESAEAFLKDITIKSEDEW